MKDLVRALQDSPDDLLRYKAELAYREHKRLKILSAIQSCVIFSLLAGLIIVIVGGSVLAAVVAAVPLLVISVSATMSVLGFARD